MSRRNRVPDLISQVIVPQQITTITPPKVPSWDTKCCLFDSSNSESIELGTDVSELSFEYNQPFSVSAWFRLRHGDLDETLGTIISNFSGAPSAHGWTLYLDIDGKNAQFRINEDTTGSSISAVLTFDNFITEIQDNNWHQLVATYDGSGNSTGAILYLDVSHSIISAGTLTGETLLGSLNCYIGEFYPNTLYFNGFIGPIGVWNKELSFAEVKSLYNGKNTLDLRSHEASDNLVGYWRMGEEDAGTIIEDWSGNDNYGTMSNMTVDDNVFDSGLYTPSYTYTELTSIKCLDYDGTNDTLTSTAGFPDITQFHLYHPLTISCWFKSSASGANDFIFTSMTAGDDGFYIQDTSDTAFQIRMGVSNILYWQGNITTPDHHDGYWHNIITTYDGRYEPEGFGFWYDGLQYYVSFTDTINASARTIDGYGPVVWGDTSYEGRITEGAIWNRVLSPEEIFRLYNQGVSTNLAVDIPIGLQHYWRFGAGVGDVYPTIVDQVGGYDLTMTDMDSGDIVDDGPGQ